MKMKFLLILACFAGIGFMSCVKDTCNGALGNTFESIQLDSGFINAEEKFTLRGTILSLSELPESYFEAIAPGDESTGAQTHNISFTKTTFELVVDPDFIPAINENIDLTFNYLFPDRMNYIDCKHSGSTDTYFLVLKFNLERMDELNFGVSNFTWDEIFLAGYL